MNEKKNRLRHVAALTVLALLLGTLLSYFIIPSIADARTRAVLGDPDAVVTNTARDPWVYVDENGLVTLYPEHMLGMTELVIPDAVNGVKVTGIDHRLPLVGSREIQTLVFPAGFRVNGEHARAISSWGGLETIVFSEGISDLSQLDIMNCSRLRAIYLPKTLTALYPYVVHGCGEDVTVYYAGTEEEWLALGKFAKILSGKCPIVFNTPVPEY